MKRYTEWQKYVKEQTDKIQKNPSSTTERQSSNATKKSPEKPFNIPIKKSYVLQSPITHQEVVIKRNYPVDVIPNPPAGTITSPSSPFTSIQDAWKTPEKSIKADTSRQQEKLLPPTMTQPKLHAAPVKTAPIKKYSSSSSTAKTREEIIERLINPTISLDEAAKIMNVCKATLRRYTAKGILPHYRTPGNQRRFKLNDVLNFMEKQKRQ